MYVIKRPLSQPLDVFLDQLSMDDEGKLLAEHGDGWCSKHKTDGVHKGL